MIRSYPAALSSGPQCPPELEVVIALVSGPLVTTIYRDPQEAFVPVNGPVAKMSLFSGLKGSTWGLTSSDKYLAPSPRPPTKSRAQSSRTASLLTCFVVRLTRSTVPVQPYIIGCLLPAWSGTRHRPAVPRTPTSPAALGPRIQWLRWDTLWHRPGLRRRDHT